MSAMAGIEARVLVSVRPLLAVRDEGTFYLTRQDGQPIVAVKMRREGPMGSILIYYQLKRQVKKLPNVL